MIRTALRPLPLALLMAAAGGAFIVGCSGSNDGPVTRGQVIGSYYENAQVCLESTTTPLTCADATTAVRTGKDGSFVLASSGNLLATIGLDAIRHDTLGDAGTAVTAPMLMRAANGHNGFVSAISTELMAIMDENGGNFAAASTKLAAKLGVSEASLVADFNNASATEGAILKAESGSIATGLAQATAQTTPALQLAAMKGALALSNIKTIVVIYGENRGFDNLYGLFPGANGVPGVNPTSTSAYTPQKDFDGSVLPVLPPTWTGMAAAGQATVITQAQSANLPNKPFQIDNVNSPLYMSQSVITRDLVHRFYNNQMQIDGGAERQVPDLQRCRRPVDGLLRRQQDGDVGPGREGLRAGRQLLHGRLRRLVPEPPVPDLRLRADLPERRDLGHRQAEFDLEGRPGRQR